MGSRESEGKVGGDPSHGVKGGAAASTFLEPLILLTTL